MHQIKWRQSALARKSRDLVVWVDAQRAEEAWSADTLYYLKSGGLERQREYEAIGAKVARRRGALPMVEAQMLDGTLMITDGDCAFRWLLDHGVSAVPLSMAWPCANRAMKLIGTECRVCEIHE